MAKGIVRAMLDFLPPRCTDLVEERSDVDLLRAWRSGDGKAGRALFDRLSPPLRRFFGSRVDEGADDLIPSTLMASQVGPRTSAERRYGYAMPDVPPADAPQTSAFWRLLPSDQQERLVKDALRDATDAFGLPETAIELRWIEDDTHVVIELVGVDEALATPLVATAQRALAADVDPALSIALPTAPPIHAAV